MDTYIEIYFYEDGTKESKYLFSEGTASAFKSQGIDALNINEGDSFTLLKNDEDILVKVFQIVMEFDKNKREYHVAPTTVSPYQFNK